MQGSYYPVSIIHLSVRTTMMIYFFMYNSWDNEPFCRLFAWMIERVQEIIPLVSSGKLHMQPLELATMRSAVILHSVCIIIIGHEVTEKGKLTESSVCLIHEPFWLLLESLTRDKRRESRRWCMVHVRRQKLIIAALAICCAAACTSRILLPISHKPRLHGTTFLEPVLECKRNRSRSRSGLLGPPALCNLIPDSNPLPVGGPV